MANEDSAEGAERPNGTSETNPTPKAKVGCAPPCVLWTEQLQTLAYQSAEGLEPEGHALLLEVAGNSMVPTLRPGDKVRIEPVPIATLRRGDLVTYERWGCLITHRLVAVIRFAQSYVLFTQGDANGRTDWPVNGRHLLGRVVEVRRGLDKLPE